MGSHDGSGLPFLLRQHFIHRMRPEPGACPTVTIYAYSPPLAQTGQYGHHHDGLLHRMPSPAEEQLKLRGCQGTPSEESGSAHDGRAARLDEAPRRRPAREPGGTLAVGDVHTVHDDGVWKNRVEGGTRVSLDRTLESDGGHAVRAAPAGTPVTAVRCIGCRYDGVPGPHPLPSRLCLFRKASQAGAVSRHSPRGDPVPASNSRFRSQVSPSLR